MPSPPKVLIVHNDYRQHGGERTWVDAQTNLLRQNNHEVIAYTRSSNDVDAFSLAQKIAFFPQAVYSRRTYREVRQLVETERPDIAHVHNVFPLISPSVYHAIKDAGIPIIQTIHNFRFLCPNGLFYTRGRICERCEYGNFLHAIRWRCIHDSVILSALYAFILGWHRRRGTFKLIDHFMVPAGFTVSKLVESGFCSLDQTSVLPHFTSGLLQRSSSSEEKGRHVVFLGRLSAEKGILTLIHAMRSLPNLQLRVLGEGPLGDVIHSYLQRHRITNVEMKGFVSGEAKWTELRTALAVIIPSECYEQSTFSLLEGSVAGTALVASNLGSLAQAVEHDQTGMLFRPGDAEDLAATLQWVADHPEEAHRMGANARRRAEVRHRDGVQYAQLLRVYQQYTVKRT